MNSADKYFDYAATSLPDVELQQKALELSLENYANPSSLHKSGKAAKEVLTTARNRAAKALGVQSKCLFFTSGGTESDHIPILSVLTRPVRGSIVISAIEHPAIREMALALKPLGTEVIEVMPDKDGFIHPQKVVEALRDDTALVSIMAVNNETGCIQPIEEIADALSQHCEKKRRPLFHTDAVQAIGKVPLNLLHSGIDAASISAHKIGGPRGIGLLYLNREIVPFLRGGGQEERMRSGTENVFGAVALSLCLEKYAMSNENEKMHTRFLKQRELTANFIAKLCGIKGCTIIPHIRAQGSAEANFSPWIVQASFKGVPGKVLQRALDAKGFCISTGSACSSGHHARPVLDAMHLSKDEKESAVRFSFGQPTTAEAMDNLLNAIREAVEPF